jgi:hypothetical protein
MYQNIQTRRAKKLASLRPGDRVAVSGSRRRPRLRDSDGVILSINCATARIEFCCGVIATVDLSTVYWVPSPQEIADGCRKIRDAWSAEERQKRICYPADRPQPVEIRMFASRDFSHLLEEVNK